MPNPSKSDRPQKPSQDFPLFAHGCGQWAKKCRGRLHYFGPWRDPQRALQRWLHAKDHLLAGLEPPPAGGEAPTLRDLVNRFLSDKKRRVESGELSRRIGRLRPHVW